jgi:hypothetical protein
MMPASWVGSVSSQLQDSGMKKDNFFHNNHTLAISKTAPRVSTDGWPVFFLRFSVT